MPADLFCPARSTSLNKLQNPDSPPAGPSPRPGKQTNKKHRDTHSQSGMAVNYPDLQEENVSSALGTSLGDRRHRSQGADYREEERVLSLRCLLQLILPLVCDRELGPAASCLSSSTGGMFCFLSGHTHKSVAPVLSACAHRHARQTLREGVPKLLPWRRRLVCSRACFQSVHPQSSSSAIQMGKPRHRKKSVTP